MSPTTEDSRERYVRTLLRLYLATPGVEGHVRRADRQMARALYARRVPLYAVADAFVVAAARRIRHNAFLTPLPPIQSLHYFRNVICHARLASGWWPAFAGQVLHLLGLPSERLFERHFPTPPLPEQRKIAAIRLGRPAP